MPGGPAQMEVRRAVEVRAAQVELRPPVEVRAAQVELRPPVEVRARLGWNLALPLRRVRGSGGTSPSR